MVHIGRLLALPPALLWLVLDSVTPIYAQNLEWPYNLAPHVKYYPEDEGLVKRNVEVRQKLLQQMPMGIKKMSSNPGEKFLLDYWQFGTIHDDLQTYDNASIPIELTAPLQLHATGGKTRSILPRLMGRSLFDKRNFECPVGSYACVDIGRENSCCGDGSTCQLVEDVGLGDVGCCPGTQVCGGSVSNCPSGGYTDCPQNRGGGCCLPGYACFEVGCVATSTAVVLVTPTPTPTPTATSSSTSVLSTSTPPPPPPSTTEDTTVVLPPQPPPTDTSSELESTLTETLTTTLAPSSTSQPPNSLACSSGFRSCPVSLGGGCCPTDRACGRDICPELSSTDSFSAPARPTSNSEGPTITTTASVTDIPGAECPTGFYACIAFYQGGCCQTGRDCDTTSCPEVASITVVDGSSITAVAPTGGGITSVRQDLTGSCAQGWSTCPQEVGGGCCPTGYGCGTVCTATATGGQGSTVGKIAPSEGSKSTSVDSQFALVVMGALLFSVTMELDVFG